MTVRGGGSNIGVTASQAGPATAGSIFFDLCMLCCRGLSVLTMYSCEGFMTVLCFNIGKIYTHRFLILPAVCWPDQSEFRGYTHHLATLSLVLELYCLLQLDSFSPNIGWVFANSAHPVPPPLWLLQQEDFDFLSPQIIAIAHT